MKMRWETCVSPQYKKLGRKRRKSLWHPFRNDEGMDMEKQRYQLFLWWKTDRPSNNYVKRLKKITKDQRMVVLFRWVSVSKSLETKIEYVLGGEHEQLLSFATFYFVLSFFNSKQLILVLKKYNNCTKGIVFLQKTKQEHLYINLKNFLFLFYHIFCTYYWENQNK